MQQEIIFAHYLLQKGGVMTTMKMHKLLFYSQALALLDNVDFLSQDFQAWMNGPVFASLYPYHRGLFLVQKDHFAKLHASIPEPNAKQMKIMDEVIHKLGQQTGGDLSRKSHQESPWMEARAGLASDQPSNNPISADAIRAYYTSREKIFWTPEPEDFFSKY